MNIPALSHPEFLSVIADLTEENNHGLVLWHVARTAGIGHLQLRFSESVAEAEFDGHLTGENHERRQRAYVELREEIQTHAPGVWETLPL